MSQGTLSLFDVSGLSQLQVTTTDGLSLSGNFRMDNAETGLGGLVDLSDAGTIFLVSDVLIDTDDPNADEMAGDIILDGALIRASTPGVQTLTLDANSFDKDANDGRIVLGDFSPSSQVGNITLSAASSCSWAMCSLRAGSTSRGCNRSTSRVM